MYYSIPKFSIMFLPSGQKMLKQIDNLIMTRKHKVIWMFLLLCEHTFKSPEKNSRY